MKYLLHFLAAFLYLNTIAQPPQGFDRNKLPKNGQVSGIVLSSKDKQPIGYAAVKLLWLRDSSLTAGAVADDKGLFLLSHIPAGRYILKITAVGEGQYTSAPFVLNPQNWTKDLGTVYLNTNVSKLKEVQIVAEKPFMQQIGEKQVYNVEQNTLSSGGTATDVLQTIPLVSVDLDGNIKLRGTTAVTVWIDGKPAISGANLTTVLQQIPANTISKVELVTNPSAKYDAEGSGGIINIVTKQPDKERVSGSIGANWVIYNKGGANAILSIKRKKWTVALNYSYMYNPRNNDGTSQRTTTFNNNLQYTDQIKHEVNISQNHYAKFSIDYDATILDRLSLSLSAAPNFQKEEELQSTALYDIHRDTSLYYLRDARSTFTNINYFGDLGWKHKFADQDEHNLTFDVFASSFQQRSENQFLNTYYRDVSAFYFPDQQNKTSGAENQLVAIADYVHPLDADKKIETGIKITNNWLVGKSNYDNYDTVNKVWVKDAKLTTDYTYNTHILAGYFTYTESWKQLNYNLGLRAEQTFVDGRVSATGATVSQQYFNLFPSGFVNYTLPHGQQLHAGYSLRIRRPWSRQVLPIEDVSDPQNIRTGNVNLKPEITHSVELQYSISFLHQYIMAGLYYKHTLNPTSFYKTFINEQVSINSPVNADYNRGLGFELVMRNSFFKRWDITTSLNVGNYSISQQQGKILVQNSTWQETFKILSSIKFWKSTYFQAGFNYESPNVTLQGTAHGFMSADAGIRKEFLDGKLGVTLNANDIFNTRKFAIYAAGDGFKQSIQRHRESRTVTLSVTYRFGNGNSDNTPKRRRGGDKTPQNFIQDSPGGGDF